MKLRTLSICIGVATTVISAVGVSGAGAKATSPANSQVAALKQVGVSWALYTANGNAQKACRLQVEPNVGGVPCDELPGYGTILYCPALPSGGSTTKSPYRTAEERVVKPKVSGKNGTVVVRASEKGSRLSGKASFLKVAGKWRIVSFQSMGRTFAPAGLIFTEGAELRKALWPPHCP